MVNVIEEYKHLYSEIDRNSQISQNVFIANVSVTAALIGYALKSQSGPIFLVPFAILIPSLFFLASQLESTTCIAAYLLVFLEKEHNELNWETRWFSIRENGPLPRRRKYTMSITWLYGLVGATCLILALIYWSLHTYLYWGLALLIVLFFGLGLYALAQSFSMNLVDSYIKSWEKVKQRE